MILPGDSSSSEDENIEWEKVEQVNDQDVEQDVEIPLGPSQSSKKRKGIVKRDRILRNIMHRSHLLTLVATACRANRLFVNEADHLAAIIISCMPSLEPDRSKFYTTLVKLCHEFRDRFNLRDFCLNNTEQSFAQLFSAYFEREELEEEVMCIDDDGNRDETQNALNHQMYVIGFAAWIRSFGFQTRLVASLHPISLSMSSKKKKRKRRYSEAGSAKRSKTSSNAETPTKTRSRSQSTTPKKGKGRQRSNSIASSTVTDAEEVPVDGHEVTEFPIVYWCEVYNTAKREWEPVCPIRCLVSEIEKMEPPATQAPQFQYSYIFALPPDTGSFEGVDLTRRYAKNYTSKTLKNRISSTDSQWFQHFLWLFTKSIESQDQKYLRETKRLTRTDADEKMPTSLAGFNNHPIYALERQLKKIEVLHPDAKNDTIGIFKDQKVYKREYVSICKSKEGWTKEGMVVKNGEMPIKFKKSQANTIKRQREIEAFEDVGLGDEADPGKSGLFAKWQVEPAHPDPLPENELIPRNSFGNFELLHPNYLPPNCAHLNIPGIGVVAKRLGTPYAPAMVGFDFSRGRSFPIVKGIVCFNDDAEMLSEAAIEADRVKVLKESKKKEVRVLKNWKTLVSKALNRERLFREYLPEGVDQRS